MTKTSILIIVILSASIPTSTYANGGPTQHIGISVFYNHKPLPDKIFYARILHCNKNSLDSNYKLSDFPDSIIKIMRVSIYDSTRGCYWEPPYSNWGMEFFENVGSNSQYYVWSFYELPPSFRAELYIPSLNKRFISNEVSRTSFQSTYRLDLSSDDSATMIETTSFLDIENSFILPLAVTLILELSVALIYISKRQLSKKVLFSVAFANCLSVPILWFMLYRVGGEAYLVVLLILEIFVVVCEAFFIFLLNRDRMKLKDSFVLSLIMNLVSFVLGTPLLVAIQASLY